MIEIAIDGNNNNLFLDKERPVFNASMPVEDNLTAYREIAKLFLQQFSNEYIAIVRSEHSSFSYNLFALALFIESYHLDINMECAVFKVENAPEALEKYRPYIALTIAVKYALRLCGEDNKTIYKEISGLGYLGLETRNDYINNKMFLSLPGKEPVYKVRATNATETLAAVAMLKALSLLHIGASFEAEIDLVNQTSPVNEDEVINKIMELIKPWIY